MVRSLRFVAQKMMHFVGGRELTGQLVRVRADEAHLWGFYGTVVG